MIQNIPSLITPEQNEFLIKNPIEEAKAAVFGLNGDNTSGPGGFSGLFYQSCWDIIGKDVTRMVTDFFCGFNLLDS